MSAPADTFRLPPAIGELHSHRTAEATGHGEAGPAPKRVVVGFGFWVFLLSDIIMFSAFFATYAVFAAGTSGDHSAAHLFDINNVAIETGCLLLSSFCCGVASLAVEQRNQLLTQLALIATGLLGFAFLFLEVREFSAMIAQGYGPSRSAFQSAFFALVGCHGAHVTLGLLWLGTMMAQLYVKGFRADIRRRYLCFSLFWHALDIIWVALFTVVYLIGAST